MFKKLFSFIFLCVSHAVLSITASPTQQEFNLSDEAYEYLNKALSYMEEGSVNRKKINWSSLKTEIYKKASNAITSKDTYEAIELALSLLEENHSFFLRPEQVQFLENNKNDQLINMIRSESMLINDQIGYIFVPPCNSLSESAIKEYALSIQQEIQALDQHKLNKWIIDLRGNSGGNMWPMVLGLRPLIQAETFGFFTDGTEERFAWRFENQSAKNQDFEVCSLDVPSYQLSQSHPWIAILVDNQTESAGEATLIAFLGAERIKVFGQKTGGYTSANEMILLKDGAAIFLATTYMADRLGKIYIEGITPDLVTETKELALSEAIQWLQ